MRLIDADALKQELIHIDGIPTVTEYDIDKAPTVDAIPTEDLRIRLYPGAEDAFNKKLWGCIKIVPTTYHGEE